MADEEKNVEQAEAQQPVDQTIDAPQAEEAAAQQPEAPAEAAKPSELDQAKADLAKEQEVMSAAGTEDAYRRLAEIKSTQLKLEGERQGLEEQPQPQLTEENLANVIELWTNIPASRIQETEYQRLEEIFVACSRYELGFWEMAWTLER